MNSIIYILNYYSLDYYTKQYRVVLELWVDDILFLGYIDNNLSPTYLFNAKKKLSI